ncbi:DUF6129 family protein [Aurantivibrio plasticivorans]
MKMQVIDDVVAFVEKQGLSEATMQKVREEHSDAHFTYCSDDDVNMGKAFRECEGFNVYLVNSSDHCSVLTNDEEAASGMVLAELYED